MVSKIQNNAKMYFSGYFPIGRGCNRVNSDLLTAHAMLLMLSEVYVGSCH